MILVYKFDFAFVQNIKISLIDLPCEGHDKPEGIHSAYDVYVSYVRVLATSGTVLLHVS